MKPGSGFFGPLLRAASAGTVLSTLAFAAWAGVEVHRQEWLSQGLLFLAAATIVDAAATAALYGATFGIGLLASAEATSPRPRSWPSRLAAVAGSWLFLLFPLTVVLAPAARQVILEHQTDAFALRMLAVIPLGWIPSTSLWAVLLRVAWLRRSSVAARGGAEAMPWSSRLPHAKWGLVAGAVLLAGELAVRAASPAAPAGARNVVFVVVDTLRADRLGAYGYSKRATSPNLDRFAGEAVVYESAASTAPWTTPSVAAMLTGRYPRRLGYTTIPSRLPSREVSVAEVFRENGYRTHAVVANMCASTATAFDTGFEEMDESQLRDLDYVSSDGVTDRALDWLGSVPGQRFFLYVHYIDPHFPYTMHSDFEYDPGYQGEFRHQTTHGDFQARVATMKPVDLDFVIAAYDSEIALADRAIGRLLDGMKALGVYDDTLVVLVSDHGESFDDRHDRFIGHGESVYEELLHVPMIVKYPGGSGAGTRVKQRVSTLDLAPTMLAGGDLAFPPGILIDGRRLDRDFVERVVFGQNYHEIRRSAVYDGAWKLHVDHQTDGRLLFDLPADPGERADLTAGRGDVANRLADELQHWESGLGEVRDGSFGFSEAGKEKLKALGYLQ